MIITSSARRRQRRRRRSIGEFFLHFHLHFSSFLSSARCYSDRREYRRAGERISAARVPARMSSPTVACVCRYVCAGRAMIGFVEDDTYAVFRDLMKFYKYFPTDNALL